jgi:GGDEF domain-containing protein
MSHDAFLGQALRDPATGLPNLPYLQLIREWEERRARRRKYDVRILEIEVTGGDERTRRSLSWRLIRALRDSDFLASQGPMRFHVLLTSPDAEHMQTVRDRIANVIVDMNTRYRCDPPLDVRITVTEEPPAAGEPVAGADPAPPPPPTPPPPAAPA